MSARIGRQSGRGIAANLRLYAPKAFLLAIVGLLLVANTINIAAGIALEFSPIDPIQALYWSAVINGVVAVPIMVAMLLLATHPQVMGGLPVRGKTRWFGWGAALLMAAAVGMMVRDLLRGVA